jgi:hypothetical protein
MKEGFHIMKYAFLLLVCLIGSCADTSKEMVVHMHTLRDQDVNNADDPMVRHEKQRRLYGAVSMEERKQRLGQYFTVMWNSPKSVGMKREIVFEYQQGKSGSLVKKMNRTLGSDQVSGKEEFSVIGDEYFDKGRVLAWRIRMIVGGEVTASEQSYLWE